ncbi:MAG: DUF3098 domain-containing protein [Flavobacteriales bacterium]|nr:DUF3098 domain-containing protein [Flavobacteriales bacterium]
MSENNTQFAFTKINYILLSVGVVFIIGGLFLMSGGKSDNPNVFDYEIVDVSLTSVKLTYSVILMVTGFIINVFAILYTPKEE